MKTAKRKSTTKPSIISWRSRALGKPEKALRALQTHHRAERAPDTRCGVKTCGKICVMGSKYCAHHRNLRVATAAVAEDEITYGA